MKSDCVLLFDFSTSGHQNEVHVPNHGVLRRWKRGPQKLDIVHGSAAERKSSSLFSSGSCSACVQACYLGPPNAALASSEVIVGCIPKVSSFARSEAECCTFLWERLAKLSTRSASRNACRQLLTHVVNLLNQPPAWLPDSLR